MNKQPVLYLQTDARWKNKPYRTAGESSTIGSAGCGPTCAAMLIETLTGKTFTPEDACNWSMERGYKALNQGTYYSYFKPQFAAFGIDCDMLNWTSAYGKPKHTNHDKALELMKQGYYLIALMNKGTWTSSGHFIVVWWADGKIRINDPASTKDSRVNGDPHTFRSEAKYYWWVDARKYNHPEEEINMDRQELKELIRETVKEVIDEENPIYKDLADVPYYWKRQAAGLLNAGAVNGGTPGGGMRHKPQCPQGNIKSGDCGRHVPRRRRRREIRRRTGGNNPSGPVCFNLSLPRKMEQVTVRTGFSTKKLRNNCAVYVLFHILNLIYNPL